MNISHDIWKAYEILYPAETTAKFSKRVLTGTMYFLGKDGVNSQTATPHEKVIYQQVMALPKTFADWSQPFCLCTNVLSPRALTFENDGSDVENTDGNIGILIDLAQIWLNNYVRRNTPMKVDNYSDNPMNFDGTQPTILFYGAQPTVNP